MANNNVFTISYPVRRMLFFKVQKQKNVDQINHLACWQNQKEHVHSLKKRQGGWVGGIENNACDEKLGIYYTITSR